MSSRNWWGGAETLPSRTVRRKSEWPTQRKTGVRERRRSQRLSFGIPIFARGVDETGKEFLEFTTTLNISAGGTLLVMRRTAALDSKVLLEIPAAPLPRVATTPELVRTLEARVVRVTSSQPSYLWALRFNQPLQ